MIDVVAQSEDRQWHPDGPRWTASWVSRPSAGDRLPARAVYLLRRRFGINGRLRRAQAFASALGAYELALNGAKAGDELMRPGWTDYRRRAQYQMMDVTDMLRPGDNVIGAILAPGWYGGRIGSQVPTASTDPVPVAEFLCQLELELDDGNAVSIGTDELWQWRPSAIVSSDLYDGEDWDRRLLDQDWSTVDHAGAWEPVERSRGTAGALVPQRGAPLRVTRLAQAHVTRRQDGSFLVDSGRNDTGFLRLRVDERRGRRVEVRYAEILGPTGQLYRDNLRSARCADSFVCAGAGPEELAPSFSYRGWRYAEVTGISEPSRLLAAESVTIGTEMARTGWFSCSEPLLEQIYELMVCSLEANYVEIPTDCPQRDERMGWMADALLFAPVAAYTYDVGPLMAKWFVDILDARTPAGGFADVAPRPSAQWPGRSFEAGAPAWADAGVQLPWLMYERYGDKERLEAMFPAMYDWLRLVHQENPDGIWRHGRGNDYGDWVPAGADTSHDLFSTCWLYRSTAIGAKVAELVGANPARDWLAARAAVVRQAFVEQYVDRGTGRVRDPAIVAPKVAPEGEQGSLAAETQTGYVLALVFDLLDPELAAAAGSHLADMVLRAGRRLQTGFTGSAHILSALEKAGHPGLAYDLLLRRDPPSLGFMVDMGATSVWERWDGLDAAGQPACPTMNSFNHYAMGSMLSWLIEGICGLRPAAGVPALGEIRFAPAVSRRLSRAAFAFEAPSGRLELGWAWDGGSTVVGHVRVPAGMTCSIAGMVAVDDDEQAVADAARSTHAAGRQAADRLVGAGDHEVVWHVP
jgi:alpha-L-rhamnosidase